MAALSAGSTSAMTSSMPSSAATRSAVARLSPESMTGRTPSSLSAAIASAAVSRGASAIGDDGRGLAVDGDLHARAALAGELVGARGEAVAGDALALQQARVADGEPAAVDGGEQPVAGHGLEGLGARDAAGRARLAALTIASASGCSLSPSAAATRRSTSSSSTPSAVATATTSGSPRVSVPVLSSTTVSSEAACSSAIACLKRMPRLAPRPVPTMIAVGVASPSASGQVMTTTVMANSSASWTSRPTTKYQTTKVSAPPMSATSTSQNAARSASRWPGALEFWASWTSLTICASAVSEPTAVARARSVPFLLMVAPMSWSPARLLAPAGSRR